VLTLSLSIGPYGVIMSGREYWWNLLGKLSAVEELELSVDSVQALGFAWGVDDAPAVLPALRSVRIEQTKSSIERVAEITVEDLMTLLQRNTE